jgi:hypothetical protein
MVNNLYKEIESVSNHSEEDYMSIDSPLKESIERNHSSKLFGESVEYYMELVQYNKTVATDIRKQSALKIVYLS